MKLKIFQFNPFDVNTYVVWDPATRQTAVIDPGMCNATEEAELSNFISEKSLKVNKLLNTHLHIDHVMGNEYVMRKYGVDLEAGKADEMLGEQVPMQAKMFGLRVNVAPVKIGHYLKAGDKVYLGDEYLEVLEVPGHSPGSLAFYAPADGFVITGDTVFNNSIGRTDLPGGNYAQLIKAITDNILSLPGNTVIYPGHGPSTLVDVEGESNPFL